MRFASAAHVLSLAVIASSLIACSSVETEPPGPSGPCDKVGDPGCPTSSALATGQLSPAFIAVDETWVYWTDFGGTGTMGAGSVMKVAITGGTPIPIATKQDKPRGIAVDADRVYWVTADGGVLTAQKGASKTTFVAPAQTPARVAVDDKYAYFTDQGNGGVFRAPKAGGGKLESLAMDQQVPFTIVADASGAYWTNTGDGSLMHWSSSGGPTVLVPAGAKDTRGVAIDETYVYWTAPSGVDSGSLSRVPKTGGAVEVIAPDVGVGEVVTDATHVYVANYTAGSVVAVSKADGSKHTLFPPGATTNPLGIAVDATYVYVANSSSGTVLRVAK
jgi:hypothetical protein